MTTPPKPFLRDWRDWQFLLGCAAAALTIAAWVFWSLPLATSATCAALGANALGRERRKP